MVYSLVCTKYIAVYIKLSVVAYHDGCWSLVLYILYSSLAANKNICMKCGG